MVLLIINPIYTLYSGYLLGTSPWMGMDLFQVGVQFPSISYHAQHTQRAMGQCKKRGNFAAFEHTYIYI